ncbi:hypothetical protein Taro_056339 [Colocasia esculenta]|uniref:Uncharacterized protein n=1 Tax=Colocasia esculenta TaxID=4460 RepID=A0A843XVG7_COLES|nr:hypothetical protein [Colocasia esculenta]
MSSSGVAFPTPAVPPLTEEGTCACPCRRRLPRARGFRASHGMGICAPGRENPTCSTRILPFPVPRSESDGPQRFGLDASTRPGTAMKALSLLLSRTGKSRAY